MNGTGSCTYSRRTFVKGVAAATACPRVIAASAQADERAAAARNVSEQSPVKRCRLKVVNQHEVSERGTHKMRKPLVWFLPPTDSHPRAGGFAYVVAR